MRPYNTHSQTNNHSHEFEDVGIELLDSYMQTNDQHNYGDASRSYWENLIAVGNASNENPLMQDVLNKEDDSGNYGPPPSDINNNTMLLSSEESDDYFNRIVTEICLTADFEEQLDRALLELQ